MTIQRVQPGKRMSQAVIHGDTVYLAGQVALGKPGGSVAEQTTDILARIDALLQEAGSDRTKLLSATIWLADMATFDEMNGGVGCLAAGGRGAGARHGRGQARDTAVHGRDRHHRRALGRMRIAVLGAGVIGIATAYELWRDGHEVVVVDRGQRARHRDLLRQCRHDRSRPCLCLVVAARRSGHWPEPCGGTIWPCASGSRPTRSSGAGAGGSRASAPPSGPPTIRRRKVALCLYSQRQLHRGRGGDGRRLRRAAGRRALPASRPEGLARAAATAQILRDQGVEVRAVDPDEAAAIDPVYEPVQDRFAGALYAPGDESGDARLFTLRARRLAGRARGRVPLRPHDPADRYRRRPGDRGRHRPGCRSTADAYVLALGC